MAMITTVQPHILPPRQVARKAAERKVSGRFCWLLSKRSLAMIAVQATGMATNGVGRIRDIKPAEIDQRTPFCVGSRRAMEVLVKVVTR